MASQTGTSGQGTSGTTSGSQGRMAGASGMMGGNRAGVSNDTYNLISVLYHCLQGCETYQQYAQDAQQAGNQELAQFFQDTLREEQQRAQRGQRLLMQCLQAEQGGSSGQMHSRGSSSQGQHMAGGSAAGQMSGSGSAGAQGQQGGGTSSSAQRGGGLQGGSSAR